MELGESFHAVEILILLLLVLVAFFAVMANRLKVPYPIVLVIAGLVISFFPRMPRIPLDPNIVFVIFLPPLLYASAWSASLREFKRNGVVIGLLAFGLVAFTVWGVAVFSDHFITALDWKAGFLLGAVVATTDAIAATSIAKSIGLPRRIVDILEGESLLNDATGLLALEMGLGIILRGESPTVASGALRLLTLVVGGVVIGLLIGIVVGWLEKFIDDGPIELVVSLVVPYAAYIAGERAHASGVLAVVVCGLYLSRQSVNFFSPSVRLQVNGAWEALTFMLNGLVFVLIGLQLPYVLGGIRGKFGTGTLIFYGAVFTFVLILLRMMWVFPAVKIAEFLSNKCMGHKEEPLKKTEVFVVGWTGMRGVLALAAAISVPEVLGNGRPPGDAKSYRLSRLLRHPGDACASGIDAAGAHSEARAGRFAGYGPRGKRSAEDCTVSSHSSAGRGTEDRRQGRRAPVRRHPASLPATSWLRLVEAVTENSKLSIPKPSSGCAELWIRRSRPSGAR